MAEKHRSLAEGEEMLNSEEKDLEPSPEETASEYDFEDPEDDDLGMEEEEGEDAGGEDDPSPKDRSGGADEASRGADAETKAKDLVEAARALGMNDEELGEYSDDPEGLAKVVRLLARRRPAGEGAAQGGGEKGEGQGEDNEGLDLPKLDPELYDEAIVSVVDKLSKEIVGLRAELKSKDREREVAEAGAFLEQRFAEISPEYVEVFGKGPTRNLAKDSEQLKHRIAVVEQMDVIEEGLRQKGRPVPPAGELFEQAMRAALGKTLEAAKERGLHNKLQRRRGVMSPRPTHRESSDESRLPPEKRAARFVRDQMRAFNVGTIEDEEEF